MMEKSISDEEMHGMVGKLLEELEDFGTMVIMDEECDEFQKILHAFRSKAALSRASVREYESVLLDLDGERQKKVFVFLYGDKIHDPTTLSPDVRLKNFCDSLEKERDIQKLQAFFAPEESSKQLLVVEASGPINEALYKLLTQDGIRGEVAAKTIPIPVLVRNEQQYLRKGMGVYVFYKRKEFMHFHGMNK